MWDEEYPRAWAGLGFKKGGQWDWHCRGGCSHLPSFAVGRLHCGSSSQGLFCVCKAGLTPHPTPCHPFWHPLSFGTQQLFPFPLPLHQQDAPLGIGRADPSVMAAGMNWPGWRKLQDCSFLTPVRGCTVQLRGVLGSVGGHGWVPTYRSAPWSN